MTAPASSKLAELIRAMFALEPATPELEFERRWYSWGEIDRYARGLADALDAAGLVAGARVGTLMRNRPELVGTLIGLFSTNRCLATLNAHAPDEALAADVERVQAPVIVGLAADLERGPVREALRRCGA